MFRSLLIAAALSLVSFAAIAADTATTPHFTAALVAESRTPVPGKDVTLALVIQPQPGWHTYWVNPGDTGLAPDLEWTLPDGVMAQETQHPVPMEMTVSGITTNVHDGPAALLTDISVPSTMHRGEALPVKLDADLLICSEGACVPESVSLDLGLMLGDGTIDPTQAQLFTRARAALPTPLSQPASYAVNGTTLKLFLPMERTNDIASAHVFIRNEGVVPAGGAQDVAPGKDGLTITLSRANASPIDGLAGVVRIVRKDHSVTGYRFVGRPWAIPTPPAGIDAGFFLALGGAILGGLLLNLMPCVFPILSLKALALARAGGDGVEARSEALGYAIGAMGVVLGLGAAVLALKSGGHAVGWAFQLQDTRVVALLLLLVTAIATNLAGLYELPSMSFSAGARQGFLGGVGTGALAAFIATPCTGPFMAGALGTALILPPAEGLAVFAGLGLGLALPFVSLGFIPPMRRWLPKPGAWMMTLRRVLSLPMFATALGLGWIVGRQAGVSAMTMALAAALLLGAALWWHGLRQADERRALPALVPVFAAVALAFWGVQAGATATSEASHLLASQPYTAARLAELRADHRPVFVFLTADWCLTCKVNEATSLSATSVADAFSKAHVAVLEGDWTRGNAEVSDLLSKKNRAGIPLYLWYPADGPAKELPQVLTPSMLVSLTQDMGAEPTRS
jgi:DsbC/DsbD-like thiol-disulfide interchange protein/cytochrome c biogenesis protein CcdA